MNIATLATMKLVDIVNLPRKEVKKIGLENIFKVIKNRNHKRTMWLVYGEDYYGDNSVICSAVSKNAAEYMVKQLKKLSCAERYSGGLRDFWIKEIPYGGFDTYTWVYGDNDFGISIEIPNNRVYN